jgi:hypothetical protein
MPRITKLTITFLLLLLLAACTAAPVPTVTPAPTLPSTETPAPTVSPKDETQPVILHQGKVVLSARLDEDLPESYVDLDKGVAGVGNKESGDIKLRLSKGSMMFAYLLPVNEASAFVHQGEKASLDDCTQALPEFSKGGKPNFFDNSVCVLTNEGRLARVVYSRGIPSPDKPDEVSFEFEILVWGREP